MTVNGFGCNPANCLIVTPAWTFSGSAFSGPNILDATYMLQSITPPSAGGSVVVVTSIEASAMGLTSDIGGVDLGGSASGTAEIANGRVVETLILAVGPNGKTAGDYLTQWLTPPPATCPPPLVGTPPECMQQPIPPTPPAPPTPPDPPQPPTCAVGVPPACTEAPSVPLPTLGEWGVLGLSVAIALAALLHYARRK